jgi:uncharacterized delta-60 repeat protein
VRAVIPAALAALAAAVLLPGAAHPQAGEPDRGFGTRGSVVTAVRNGSADRCFELLVQPDRKLVCVGQSVRRGSSSQDVVLVRYLADGRLDQSFGSNGISLFDRGGTLGEVAASAVLAPDGKILVAGVADVTGADRQDIFVARSTTDGRLDANFGGAGFVTVDASATSPDLDWAYAVALQPDGKIVVTGQGSTTASADRSDAVLLRFTSTGELDQSFGSGGLLVDLTDGRAISASSLLVQPDAKIVIGSYTNRLPYGVRLARFHRDGRADGSFGARGIVQLNLLSGGEVGGEVRSIVRQPDGKILVGGWGILRDDTYSVLARFQANGRVDRGFGHRGRMLLKLEDGLSETGVYAAELQRDGKIVVAGGHAGRFLVARYLKDGSQDSNFGGIGFVSLTAGGRTHGYASAVRIQADGRIVAAGAASKTGMSEDFALVRIEARPAAATRFSGFTVRTRPRGAVVVDWVTRAEVDTGRFLLYRQHAGRLKLVGRFVARGTPMRGAAYSMIDHPPPHSSCCPGYWLVEVKRNGRQVRYGPVAR